MKKLLILALLASLCYGQPWSNVLSSSRATDWTKAGLPASFLGKGGGNTETTTNPWTPPTRTQFGSTVNPSGVPATDLSNINTALTNCTDGHYVLLGSGTFLIQGTIVMYQHSCSLRGSGPQSTKLSFSGSGVIFMGAASSGGSTTLSVSPAAGATSLTAIGGNTPAVGNIAVLSQCDTGFSGSGCSTGSTADNGGLYVCGDNLACMTDSPASGPQSHQSQTVRITSVAGTCSSSCTVGISPAVYMGNWSTARTAILTWNNPTYNCVGCGIEDLTVYSNSVSGNETVQVDNCYACWVQGVRFVGSGAVTPLYFLAGIVNSLLSNNYFFSDIALDANFPPAFQFQGSTATLVLNNISASGVPGVGEGLNVGNVWAYNYGRDTFTLFNENKFFDHHAYSSLNLMEQNQIGEMLEDNTWGTHDLNTYFRNYASCWDTPYVLSFPQGLAADKFHRFENFVGNAIGTLSQCSTYQGNVSASGVIYRIDTVDALVASTMMRWGNASVVLQAGDTPTNSGIRFVSSEVPSGLPSPNTAFSNPVPSSNNLPCSFFLAGYTSTTCTPHSSGGTELNWWKVCTGWTTFPTNCSVSQAQPFPIAGPDVTGGSYVNGHAYDIPASIAWQNLPVDTTYQNSYTITSSSWSSGTQTLTITGLPNVTHLMGAFQLSGVNAACSTGATFGANSEILMTGSSSTTVRYALASNPGVSCTGTFKFPDVRQFDDRVYQNDPAASSCTADGGGICITGLSAIQNNLLGPLTPYGSNPWIFGDLAEKGTADNMAPKALAQAPALGTALSGTVSHISGTQTITTTADLTVPLAGQSWVAIAWNSVDGTATGRALCPIGSVTSNTITCQENMQEPDFSGVTAYLLPPAVTLGGQTISFESWTTENPNTTWNYYDVAIALYRLYYRTLNATYLTQAQQYADITWQWTLDHGYRSVAPRASTMLSQFFRASEGHSERLPGLYNWISFQVPRWANISVVPDADVREAGVMLWNIALGAKVDTDPTRHAQYCSWLSTYTAQWTPAQYADGSWGSNVFAQNSFYVSAPKSFTPPFLYVGYPWNAMYAIKGLQAAYESLNDTTQQGCNDTSLATTILATITDAITWQNNYGRDTTNRGIYYEVNSQSADQDSVPVSGAPAAGTVTATLTSTAVTGSGTGWLTAGYCDGTHFIGFLTTSTIYKIASCSSNTAMVISNSFGLYSEMASISGGQYRIAPAATAVCHSSATYCFGSAGDRNLTRTVCGGMGWLYAQTLNATYLSWTNECLSATLGGPTSGLTSAASIGAITLPCSGPACDGLVTDMVAAAADCGSSSPPCISGSYVYTNLGKNFGEAFGAPGIDNALAWRLSQGLTCSPRTGLTPPNVLDIQFQINMALGTATCTNNLTQTGSCNVADVQRVINAALGQACVIGPSSDDEFVGPFPSWTNLVTSYGTSNAAIQTALNELGTSGHSHVLWVPCGTYSITGLTMPPREGVSVFGENPSCVTFLLAAGSMGPLLRVNAVDYSAFSRITFDGGGNTSAVLVEQSGSAGGFFDTGNEYADDVFQNAGVGLRCGWLYNGCSEITIIRDHFTNISGACVFTGNYNALDIWVRYSTFTNCGVGVGNYDGTNVGAGNLHVYNSNFFTSTTAHIDVANTTPFSFRGNYFSGSPYAIFGAGTGNPAPTTIQNNTFIDQTTQAVNMGNQGPILFMDNSVRQASATLPSAYISVDGVAVGNRFTLGPNPISASQRLFESGTQIVASGAIDATPPVLPGTQPNMGRQVFEVIAGANAAAIQASITSACALNGSRPVVHLPEGQYSINVPLSIPANCDLQLTGDGYFATILNWTGALNTGPLILIAGPSHATLRNFRVNTNLLADGIGAYSIDQSGSRVFLHGVQAAADNLASNANLFYDQLDYAVMDIEDTGHSATTGAGMKVVGGTLAAGGNPAGGMVRFWDGSGNGEILPYSISAGGTLLLRDYWNESQGPAFASIVGRAAVTFDGVHANVNGNVGQATPAISISALNGKVSLLTNNAQDRTVISGSGTAEQVLQSAGDQDCPVITPYLINNTSPAGVSGLLNHRECTTIVPGTGSIPTTNTGTIDSAFVLTMLAQDRAAQQAPLTTLPTTVTDLRMYRVWTNRGINGIHLTTVRTNLQ